MGGLLARGAGGTHLGFELEARNPGAMSRHSDSPGVFGFLRAVRDGELPAHLKLTMFALLSYADVDGGGIYPSMETVARNTSRGCEAARRDVKTLTQLGILEVVGRRPGGGTRVFRINLAELRAFDPHVRTEPSPASDAQVGTAQSGSNAEVGTDAEASSVVQVGSVPTSGLIGFDSRVGSVPVSAPDDLPVISQFEISQRTSQERARGVQTADLRQLADTGVHECLVDRSLPEEPDAAVDLVARRMQRHRSDLESEANRDALFEAAREAVGRHFEGVRREQALVFARRRRG